MTKIPDYCQVCGCSGTYCRCQTAKTLTTPKMHYVLNDGINWQPVMVAPTQVDPIVVRLDEIIRVLKDLMVIIDDGFHGSDTFQGAKDPGEPVE